MENSEKGNSRRRRRVVWEKEVEILWYVIQTKSGLEEKCMQQCIQYIDKKDYVEIFVPQYIEKKHFKKEWQCLQFSRYCTVLEIMWQIRQQLC